MIDACCKLADREDPYDCQDFSRQCSAQCTLCVPIKSEEREDRFCTFTGISEETDLYDCGFAEESEMKDEKEYNIDRVKRYIRWVLIAQIVFWGYLGIMFVSHPEAAQFDIMMTNEYVNALNAQSYRHFQIEDEHAPKENPGFVLSSLLNTLDVGDIFSKFTNPPDITASDKEKFITHTSEVVEGLVKHAVDSSIATPARMLGVLFLQFAVVSFYLRISDIHESTFAIYNHVIWAGAAIFCCAVASSGASQNFIFAMAAFNICMLIAWLMIDKKLTQYKTE
jgi:hypothetical protein